MDLYKGGMGVSKCGMHLYRGGIGWCKGGIKVWYEHVYRWCGSDCALICSDARKCDPQLPSCPPLTAQHRISQIPVCYGIKYLHLKKLGMRMIICMNQNQKYMF